MRFALVFALTRDRALGGFVRVLIVDDQEFIRRGVRAVLSEEEDIYVCGEATDGREAIAKTLELKPDVVIMDIRMPRLDGLEATREICRDLPGVQVVTLSQYDLPEIVKEAREAGAVTHVSKLFVWTLLVPALRSLPLPGASSGAQNFTAPALSRQTPRATAVLERALRESEERFRCTFEVTAVGMGHVSEDGRWLRVNQKLCEMLGYKKEEIQQLKFQDITHPADRAGDLAQAARIAAGEVDHYSMDKRYIHKNGGITCVHLSVYAVRGPQGALKYCVRVAEDISARKEAEEKLAQAKHELQAANRHLELIGNRMSLALSRCSRGLRYLWVNQNYADWLGHSVHEIVGRRIVDILGNETFQAIRHRFDQVLAGEDVDYEQHNVVYAGIGTRSVSAAYRPTRDSAGIPDGWVAMVQDITNRGKAASSR
jgi:PAS domain S-box-containing protein